MAKLLLYLKELKLSIVYLNGFLWQIRIIKVCSSRILFHMTRHVSGSGLTKTSHYVTLGEGK